LQSRHLSQQFVTETRVIPMPVTFADSQNRTSLSRAAREGRLRRVTRGIYTDELEASDEEVVARHRWEMVAHVVPDAVIVDRSAASGGAPAEGVLFVASQTRARDVALPGLLVAVREAPRLSSDQPWAEGLHISSPARTLVDNLAVSRKRGKVARTLSLAELGDWVARQARLLGEERLNRLRVDAKQIAAELGVPERKRDIDNLVGAALGTRRAPRGSKALAARAMGRGYDEERVAMFEDLAGALARFEANEEVPGSLPQDTSGAGSSLAFWEAYFSNYIEGTIFSVEEAERIVETGEPPTDRPADGHDILGTHHVVADPVERAKVPFSESEFLEILRSRNAEILAGRPELGPGEWKRQNNQAGTYVFVPHDLVEGTLAEGFVHRDRMSAPIARALYMHFVVSEVHPFTDGNGRVARTVMNAELSHVGETRIVIPIVWRNEYLTSMRQISREQNVQLYMRTLGFAWRWTAAINWSDPPTTRLLMERTNALVDSNEAAESGWRLLLPGTS
jgi:hypothetical protein